MKRQNEMMVLNIFLVFTVFTVTLSFGSARLVPSFDKSDAQITSNRIFNEVDNGDAPNGSLEDEDYAPTTRKPSPAIWARVTLRSKSMVNAVQGQNVLLTCEIMGVIPLSIVWYKRSGLEEEVLALHKTKEPIRHVNGRERVTVRTEHLIKCVQPEDVGSYSCAVIAGEIVRSNETLLTVTEGNMGNKCEPLTEPVMSLSTSIAIGPMGSTMIIPCRALPPYRVQWTDSKGTPLSHSSNKQILPQGDLMIKDLRWSDMNNYYCRVLGSTREITITTFVYPFTKE